MTLGKIAELLDNAALEAEAIEQISKQRILSLEESYAVQGLSLARRYKRLEQFSGIKLGFTSKAKMEQMGVHDLIWGRLTDRMQYIEDEQLDSSQFIHPRAEPEIAFRLSADIDKILDRTNVSQYIDAVSLAIEIIDSRYKNFKFSLEDVIADNCSSAGYILGEWHELSTPYAKTPISLFVNDECIQSGNASAILGDPLQSVFEASRLVIENGESLEAGHIILAGAATAAVHIKAGDKIKAKSPDLGMIELEII